MINKIKYIINEKLSNLQDVPGIKKYTSTSHNASNQDKLLRRMSST